MIDLRAIELAAAFLLDLAVGDPERFPHPVRLVGASAVWLEARLTRLLGRSRLAGVLLVGAVVGGTGAAVWAAATLASRLAAPAGFLVEVYLLFAALGTRQMDVEASRVQRALERGDLAGARRAVSRIVGRDTDRLEEAGVSRAAVESVAESTVDGTLSPLVYAALGGAPLAWAFKAASTLDSLFGYRSERHREVGWASARLDDAMNWLPARLSRSLFAAGAWICGLDGRGAWGVAGRDGRRSPSPNAGIPEAAMAGALGVELGGPIRYGGVAACRPRLGAGLRSPEPRDIGRAVRLMHATCALALVALLGARSCAVVAAA